LRAICGVVNYRGSITIERGQGLEELPRPILQLDAWAVGTGIPNLDAIDIGLILVLITVGAIGLYGVISSYREVVKLRSSRGAKA
jgi:hypothetical protein